MVNGKIRNNFGILGADHVVSSLYARRRPVKNTSEYMKVYILELRRMKIWLIIAAMHTTSVVVEFKPEKNIFRPERDSSPWPLTLSYMKQYKKRKQTLKRVQYGLAIIFNL